MVAESRPLGSLVWLTLEVPGWPGARPGQFALLQAERLALLPGPAALRRSSRTGRWSRSSSPPSERARGSCAASRRATRCGCSGPLGNGFDLDALDRRPGRAVHRGRGSGRRPVPAAAVRGWPARPRAGGADAPGSSPAARSLVLLGFRDAARRTAPGRWPRPPRRCEEPGVACPGGGRHRGRLASAGRRGSPTSLARAPARATGWRSCGPWAMAAAVWRVCAAVPDVEAWFSLEAGMACGVGSCHGCVVTARRRHAGPGLPGRPGVHRRGAVRGLLAPGRGRRREHDRPERRVRDGRPTCRSNWARCGWRTPSSTPRAPWRSSTWPRSLGPEVLDASAGGRLRAQDHHARRRGAATRRRASWRPPAGMINAIGLSGRGARGFRRPSACRVCWLALPADPERRRVLARGVRGARRRAPRRRWTAVLGERRGRRRVGLELNISCPNVHSRLRVHRQRPGGDRGGGRRRCARSGPGSSWPS